MVKKEQNIFKVIEDGTMTRILVPLMFVTAVVCQLKIQLNTIREWKQIDFDFPSPSVRAEAIKNGMFIQSNVLPIDVDVDYQSK